MVRPLDAYLADLEDARAAGELTQAECDAARDHATQFTRHGGSADLPRSREAQRKDGTSFAASVRAHMASQGAYVAAGPSQPSASPAVQARRAAPTVPGDMVIDALQVIAWSILVVGIVAAVSQANAASEASSGVYSEAVQTIAFVTAVTTVATATVFSVLLFGLRAIIQLLQRLVAEQA